MELAHPSVKPADSSELPPKADTDASPASSAAADLPDRECTDDRPETVEKRLKRLNAHTPGALHQAAKDGKIDDVKFLIQHGHSVHKMVGYPGRTALHKAAGYGRVDVIAELIKNGAEVDARNHAGDTALFYAVQYGHIDAITELIKNGAEVDARNQAGDTALFNAAGFGHLGAVQELIKNGAEVDARNKKGATALFGAAGFGRMDVVKLLLKLGASVTKQSLPNGSSLGGKTPLTATGCMEIFKMLIKAGAPVNVRNRDNGETPLLSVARWNFAAGVHLLISSGGALRDDDVAEANGCPLIPGTLETIKSMCAATIEFESMCNRVVTHFQDVCAQLQARDPANIQEGALVTIATILVRFYQLQLDVKERQTPLSRFIRSRVITSNISEFHEELNHFANLLGLAAAPIGTTAWKTQWNEDESLLYTQFKAKLADDEILIRDCGCVYGEWDLFMEMCRQDPAEHVDIAFVINRLKKFIFRNEQDSKIDDADRSIATSESNTVKWSDTTVSIVYFNSPSTGHELWTQAGLKASQKTQSWTIPLRDLLFNESDKIGRGAFGDVFKGSWLGTPVVVKFMGYEEDPNTISTDLMLHEVRVWHRLSHPHVLPLYGANHRGKRYFVCEFASNGELRKYLSKKGNEHLMWKMMYEAALGLQYLHGQNVVLNLIKCDNIMVGMDGNAKLIDFGLSCLLNEAEIQIDVKKMGAVNWRSPEYLSGGRPSFASDVYSFAMCIVEVVSGDIPWGNLMVPAQVRFHLKKGNIPDLPESVSDKQRNLIKLMTRQEPSQRVNIGVVVNKLSEIVREESFVDTEHSITTSGVQSQSVEEHLFAKLDGATIPEALKRVAYKCDRLPEEDQWMSKIVLPVLKFIFDLLQQQQKTANDIEVEQFCTALSRFQHHLREARSENSIRRFARSRRVAESNNVIYSELDRLLDMLDVSAEDPIRQWRHNTTATQQNRTELDGPSDTSEGSGSDVSVVYFDSPSMDHELWTQTGLKASQKTQSWTIPLRDLLFNESDQIGRGAFGDVFKGSWLGTPVVVKFMGYEEDPNTISTDLLLHEVRVWHRLKYLHVLRLYGANHQDKRYFVCEYASNGELSHFLRKPGNKHLAWKKLHEVALGLQYLHGQNVVHNDLKCDNIMVGMDGNAKLIDFGLSCLLNEAEIQIDVKKMGAVNWRSPEYLSGGRPSFASDVYSFAMCIVEVISGKIPWGHLMIPAQVRFHLKKGNIPYLPESVNEKQRNLIKLMTKQEPSQRVNIGFVLNKLSEIEQEESSRGAAP